MPVVYGGNPLTMCGCVPEEKRKVDKQGENALCTAFGDMLFYHLTLKSGFRQIKLFMGNKNSSPSEKALCSVFLYTFFSC